MSRKRLRKGVIALIRIGLTGGIASGKSTVSNYLVELGAKIIDADKLARELVQPGSEALQEIKKVFGSSVIDKNGCLDRKRVGKLVFNNPTALQKLNNILHPRIIKETKRLIEEYRMKNDTKVVVVDAPLLIEVGMNEIVDEVWVVAVPESVQLERINKRDGLSEEEGRKRLSSQMALEKKLEFADRVIDNSGTLEKTKSQVDAIWQEIVTFSKKDGIIL